MAWIKRNLFFVVGGIIALGLLGGAGFYIYKTWNRNATAFTDLNEVVDTLKGLTDKKPQPGNDKTDNTQIARDQDKQLQAWLATSAGFFQPIPPIPSGDVVTSEAYAGALRRTIDQLQKEAEAAGVMLPPKYDFSFSAQRTLVKVAAGLDLLAVQLGEVKSISEILFDARINGLDSIQRVRVSDDDLNGPASDYIDEQPLTNSLAIITPYTLTFRCFTPELSRVLAGFAKAPNTYIIKYINVQPAGAGSPMGGGPGMLGENPAGAPPMMGQMPPGYGGYGGYPPPTQPQAGQTVPGKGGLQTVLKEQLLRVTAEVELVKLLPKN
jgi:hypothetical protein